MITAIDGREVELPPGALKVLDLANVVLTDYGFESLRYLDEGESVPDTVLGIHLPPQYEDRYDNRFVRQFIVTLGAVSVKLHSPAKYRPASAGEAVALSVMRQMASIQVDMLSYEGDLDAEDATELDSDGGILDSWLWDVITPVPEQALARAERRRFGRVPADPAEWVPYEDWFRPFDETSVLPAFLTDV